MRFNKWGALIFPMFRQGCAKRLSFRKRWFLLGSQRSWECSRNLARCVGNGIFQWPHHFCWVTLSTWKTGAPVALAPLTATERGPARCYQRGQGHTQVTSSRFSEELQETMKSKQSGKQFKRFKQLSETVQEVPCCWVGAGCHLHHISKPVSPLWKHVYKEKQWKKT